jgi:Zn-dependent protease with chaperone function
MLRVATLLAFALLAQGQQRAYLSIQATSGGALDATLTIPNTPVPAELPAALAHAIGCNDPGPHESNDPRIVIKCPAARTSALGFHAAFRLADLKSLLAETGADELIVTLTPPRLPRLQIDPQIGHIAYTLDELPPLISLDAGFSESDVRALAATAAAMIVAPFLLLVLRPRDPLQLRVQVEGIFVFSWILWIWVTLRTEAGALLTFLTGHWTSGLVMLAPPLAAVWIGSRLAARAYERMTPCGISAEHYRRARFWTGAATASIASSLLILLMSNFENALETSYAGIALTIGCILRARSLSRGGSHPIASGELHQRIFALAGKAQVNLRGISMITAPEPRPPVAFATRYGVVMVNQDLVRLLPRREVDAILCHELSHIGPASRAAMLGIYFVLVATVLAVQFQPGIANVIPVSLLATYFLVKFWRRNRERKADQDSVRWSGDPEAMITGLTRVSRANGMPLTWGAPTAWLMSHPPTMDRIHAIARAGGVTQTRVVELMTSLDQPTADRYPEAGPIPEDPAQSPAMRQRMRMRIMWFTLLSPLSIGFPAVLLFERLGLAWWAVLIFASAISMIAMIFGFEWVVGAVRQAVKRRAQARHGQGIFAGFSPAAEPRLFEGAYHYDMGMVRFANGALEFTGDRTNFVLDRRLVERVWLADGPRNWTPRQVIYIECRPSVEAAAVIFSLQSFEAWFWPSTTTAAQQLYREVEKWRETPFDNPAPPLPCALPQVAGAPEGVISFRTALRAVAIYGGIGFILESFQFRFDLTPPFVCALLSVFLMLPRMPWGRLKTMPATPPSLPADS